MMDYFEYTKRCRNTDHRHYGPWQKEYCRMIGRCLELSGKRVLDLGCAAGAHIKGFIDLCGADAFGCDVNPIKSPFYNKRSRLAVVSTDRLAEVYGARSFDVVHSSQVFEHFPSKKYSVEVVKGLATIVRPGGLVYVSLVTGPHRTEQEVIDDPAEDSTHVNIRPMDWWHGVFEAVGFINADAVYQPRFEAETMYQKYRWRQMFWRVE